MQQRQQGADVFVVLSVLALGVTCIALVAWDTQRVPLWSVFVAALLGSLCLAAHAFIRQNMTGGLALLVCAAALMGIAARLASL